VTDVSRKAGESPGAIVDPGLATRVIRAALGGGGVEVTDDSVNALAACGGTIVYRPGDMIFESGAASEYCHLVLRGVVELYRESDRQRVITRLGSGRFVGDIAVFLGVPYLSSARAGTFAEIQWFERGRLLDVIDRYPDVTRGWLANALSSLAESHRRLDLVLGRTATQQVAGALLDSVDRQGRVAITQSGLAALLGVGRQTINRALGDLVAAGLVRTGYRFVEVVNPAGLRLLFDADT